MYNKIITTLCVTCAGLSYGTQAHQFNPEVPQQRGTDCLKGTAHLVAGAAFTAASAAIACYLNNYGPTLLPREVAAPLAAGLSADIPCAQNIAALASCSAACGLGIAGGAHVYQGLTHCQRAYFGEVPLDDTQRPGSLLVMVQPPVSEAPVPQQMS